MLIQEALEKGPFSIQDFAEDVGVSYHTLYSWVRGRRTPQPESVKQVAEGLRKRAKKLEELAAKLDAQD